MRAVLSGAWRRRRRSFGLTFVGAACMGLSGVVTAGITHSIDPANPDYGDQLVETTSTAQTFTVTNEGTVSTINVSSVALSGANAADFSIDTDNCTSVDIAPQGTCTVDVSFTPSARGARSASLDVTVDIGVVPSASLSGNGIGPAVDVSPSPLDLGSWSVGATSTASTVTVTNTGETTLTISDISISGTNAGDFNILGNLCTSPVASLADCTFQVTFTPSAAGARSAQVDITSDALSSPDALSVSGTGTEPGVGLSPTSVDFGSVTVGIPSSATTVTLTNTGNETLNVGTLSVIGTNPGDFAISADTCSSAAVAGAADCTFDVTFTPAATGARSASVDIPSDAPSTPDTLGLSGNGVASAPAVSLSPDPVSFGTFDVGVPSGPTTVTLTNTGTETLNVGTLAVSGANSGDFALSADTCSSAAVAVSTSCTFDVTFTPGAQGPRSAQVDIPSDAPTSPDALALSGSGAGAAVSLSPSSVNFGVHLVGTISAPETVTLDNTGTSTVNVGTIAIAGGAKGSEFNLVNDNCSGQAVAASSSCTFDVTYSPTAVGSSAAQVTVPSDAPTSPDTVALSGSGATAGGGFQIGSGMSGSYFDPSFEGQGINVEMVSVQNQKGGSFLAAVVYWYSFDTNGFPFFSFGVGTVVNDTIMINMLYDYDGNGPSFGPEWNLNEFEPRRFAEAVITAIDCDNLLFEFIADDQEQFPSHLMLMERITTVAGVPCSDNKNDPVLETEDKGSAALLRARSGSYYDPDFNGQGFNIEVLNTFSEKGLVSASAVVYWYSFDPRGLPFFAFGVGQFTGNTLTVQLLVDYDGMGPFFGPDWDPLQFEPVPFANVTVDFVSCTRGDGSLEFEMIPPFDEEFEEHTMFLQRITSLAGAACP